MGLTSSYTSATNFVFLGEAGSGKTELSLNLAQMLAETSTDPVVLYDMDQTKGFFRSRDLADQLKVPNLRIAETINYMDSPLSPPGVERDIERRDCLCVLDVGGNVTGAQMIGKYNAHFILGGTEFLYVINPYRPFSEDTVQLRKTMQSIAKAAHVDADRFRLIANPCVGDETTAELALEACESLSVSLADIAKELTAFTVEKSLYDRLNGKTKIPLYPITIHVRKLYQL